MARQDSQAVANTKRGLRDLLQTLLPRIAKDRDRRIGEENTKTTLIEPVLEALGWNIREWEEVHKEFRAKPGDNPVDYAVKTFGKPRLFIEAKGLGENLSDRKWVSQVLAYATTAGVVWCVLTDGDEYRFYNSTAPVDAEEKEFCKVRLSQANVDEVVSALASLSRDSLDGDILEEQWTVHFVDRRVKAALDESLNPPEKELVGLIHRKVPELARKDIVASFARLDIRVSLAAGPTTMQPQAAAAAQQSDGEAPTPQREHVSTRVNLTDLIDAKLLNPPVRLFRRYKGQMLEATVLPDGGVEFQEKRYGTCSGAGEAAKATIAGRKVNTDGWSFWQVQDEQGRVQTLDDLRQAYLKRG